MTQHFMAVILSKNFKTELLFNADFAFQKRFQ